MDGILKILKKENGTRALSAPALDTIIFKRVYWYMQQISGECLQDRLPPTLMAISFYFSYTENHFLGLVC